VRLLDLTLPTAAENLALDEALLEAAENDVSSDLNAGNRELLRFWESPEIAVVLGRSGKVAEEVNEYACRTAKVPVLRRTSGGGTVVIGPGCLQYSLLLSYALRPQLRMLDEAHRFVLSTVAEALNELLDGDVVDVQGTSDLAIGQHKISGNSLRCKRDFLLYHGTFLYEFDLRLAELFLLPPPRQPKYRRGRKHTAFMRNMQMDPENYRFALTTAWEANELVTKWPEAKVRDLVEQRYSKDEWNRER
jgi:lipoate-protein ligase A